MRKNDARHIEVEISGYKIHSVYVPAGGDEPNAATNKKFHHKLDFLDRLSEFVADRKNDKMVLCGDLNVAPYEDDVWSHKQLKNVVSHTDIERKKLLKRVKSPQEQISFTKKRETKKRISAKYLK